MPNYHENNVIVRFIWSYSLRNIGLFSHIPLQYEQTLVSSQHAASDALQKGKLLLLSVHNKTIIFFELKNKNKTNLKAMFVEKYLLLS